jgi:hypothetical protein
MIAKRRVTDSGEREHHKIHEEIEKNAVSQPKWERPAEQQADATANEKIGEDHAKSDEIVRYGSHDRRLRAAVATRFAINPASDRLQDPNEGHSFGVPVDSRE